jgi:NADPH-dependent glutamate synthase beta subunit-like oxidoreductase
MLRRLGHEVDVFDDLPIPGGMLLTGYPDHRMPKTVVRRDNDPTAWGVRFFGGARVTREQFAAIVEEYDLTLVATGKYAPGRAGIPGEDAEGMWNALSFLRALNQGQRPRIRKALVLGAGQSAIDAAQSARRLGAEVTVCYRRTVDLMTRTDGRLRKGTAEVQMLAAEGIPYVFLVQPTRILADETNHVTGVEFVRTEVGPPDAEGQPSIIELPGTEHIMECDTVIECFGLDADLAMFPDWIRIERGSIVVDRADHRTSHPKVFAAGDAIGDKGNDGAAVAAIQAAITMDSILREEPFRRFDSRPLR